MTMTREQVEPHLDQFLDMLDATFRRYGSPDGLPNRFREALRATPRHLFVHRFRIGGGPLRVRADEGALRDNDADPIAELADIYSDAVMTHVDASGDKLPSTNSQPSYVLWLLHMLDLRPGQHVLEIGSGSGWLAAVMARLVGESGRVTGIEVIRDLAVQSRIDLAGLGIGNVAVLATDGAKGHAAGAPFDRVMITAACWDLPAVLFDQVAEGGRILVPVELRGGGCQVTVLRREGNRFVAEQAVPGWFVPLLGPGQDRPRIRFPLTALPFWDEISKAPSRRAALPLATDSDGSAGSAVSAFRAFLGRVAPGFAIFGEGEPPEQRPWLPAEPFGFVDESDRSVAIWSGGELFGYGGQGAVRSLAQAYAMWATYGMPGMAGMGLQIMRADAASSGDELAWREERGGTTLVWHKQPQADHWKVIADGDL